jgi:hypothetical protein
MVDSLRNETTVDGREAAADFGVDAGGVSSAIARALIREDVEFSERHWSDVLACCEHSRWGGLATGGRRVSSGAIRIGSEPEETFRPIQRIGGETGWYSTNWFWRVRGWLDRIRGGVGLRRGRRDPVNLRVGDEVDFWRVERLEPGRLLRLTAEMNIPGRLWLQFEVSADEGCSILRQTTVFDPLGVGGLAYWYLLYPVHRWVFARLLAGIESRLGENRQGFGRQPAQAGMTTDVGAVL